MNYFAPRLIVASIALVGASAFAQDAMKKTDTTPVDGTMNKQMTMEQCKDHMAMSKKSGAKKDDAMMKSDKMCADMMKKDAMPSAPMKGASGGGR